MNEWRCQECGAYFESIKVEDEDEICPECKSENTEFVSDNSQ